MHELNRHRALADGRGDAFDRVGSHITRSEHTGAPALEQKRLPLAGPVRGLHQRRTGHDEALGVPYDLRRSQSVRGTAPMKLNTAGVSTVRFSPVLLLTISMDLRWPSPFMRCTVELRSSSMLGVCSIRLAR